MPLLISNLGERILIDWMLRSVGGSMTLKLYSNDFTPLLASVVGDFTESTFTGYSARTLARSGWGAPATNAQGKGELQFSPDLTWTAASSQTVQGYFVVDASNVMIFAEKFAQSRNLVSGDILTLSARFTLASET